MLEKLISVVAEKDMQKAKDKYERRYGQSEVLLKNVLAVTHCHIFLLDRKNEKILYSNLSSDNVEYVTEKEDGCFLNAEKIFSSLKNPEAVNSLIGCLHNQKCCDTEKYLEFINGKKGWYRIRVKPLKDEGTRVGTLLIVKNTTEEHERREALLEATHKQKKAFMALSHEFRTPINAISVSTDMLSLSEKLGAKEKSHIRNIKQAYKGLLSIVSKATDYTKLQSGELTIEKREFTIYDLLDNIRTLTHIRAHEKGLGYCVDIAPDVPGRLIDDLDEGDGGQRRRQIHFP